MAERTAEEVEQAKVELVAVTARLAESVEEQKALRHRRDELFETLVIGGLQRQEAAALAGVTAMVVTLGIDRLEKARAKARAGP